MQGFSFLIVSQMNINRVLIKISGEALSSSNNIFDSNKILSICNDIKNIIDIGIEVSIVIGGGNIIRGRSFSEIAREEVDSMGMIATSINGIALRNYLLKIGLESVVVSSFPLPFGIEDSNFQSIHKHIKDKKIVIFVGGAGQPYFSTDTISIINAITTRSDILLKSTKIDGIYDKDPLKFSDAEYLPKITHKEAIERNIKVMDQTAFSIAMDHDMPIMVFSIKESDCFVKAINKSIKYSLVIS